MDHGHLWEKLAEEITKKGGKILKGYKVLSVYAKNNKIEKVICQTDKGKIEIKADIFISSIPLSELTINMQGEEVPDRILEIAKGLPFRDFITVGVLTKKLKLKNETNIKTLGDIIPDCWIYVQEPDVKMCRIQIFNNWSPYLLKDPQNTVWIGIEYTCNENDEYWNMEDEEFTNFAIQELINIGIIEKEDIIDTHLEKVKKAYPAYFDTYKDIQELIDYINKYENLYCIGRNGQHRYNNMDHSMLTGIEAVSNIINNKKDKTNIWNVNTEKEYHEEKK